MRKKDSDNGDIATDYLHGYSAEEQQRLLDQGEYLEDFVFPFIDLSKVSRLLEVGGGVGAQTRILLRRFPQLKITSIDYEATQVEKAKEVVAPEMRSRVSWEVADATALPYGDKKFDGAFLCWMLEHVPKPLDVLKEVHRVLEPKGIVYATEVFNTSFFTIPDLPAIHAYWLAFNEQQKAMGGDPNIGGKLAGLMVEAGFVNIETHPIVYELDARSQGAERAEGYAYWKSLFLSAAPGLLKTRRTTQKMVEAMEEDFKTLETTPNSVLFLMAMQARAEKA